GSTRCDGDRQELTRPPNRMYACNIVPLDSEFDRGDYECGNDEHGGLEEEDGDDAHATVEGVDEKVHAELGGIFVIRVEIPEGEGACSKVDKAECEHDFEEGPEPMEELLIPENSVSMSEL
ncbi:11422_t:CDS:1, partial [Acaulospora colombiana]